MKEADLGVDAESGVHTIPGLVRMLVDLENKENT
jgi:hypothetical protein